MEKIGTMVKLSTRKREAFSGLVDTYEKLVFSICYKITGDYFAAEDLTQETFLSAFQKYDTFDGSNEKAWVCRIATNKSIDFMRSSSRKNTPTEDVFFDAVEDKRENPEEMCIEKEVKRQLKKICQELKPPYDEIAKEYYLNELTALEIAEKKGINVKTIQTQIYRARDMLRKKYGKEQADEQIPK